MGFATLYPSYVLPRSAARERARSRFAPTSGERRNAARIPPFFFGGLAATSVRVMPRFADRFRFLFVVSAIRNLMRSKSLRKHIRIFIRQQVDWLTENKTEAARPPFFIPVLCQLPAYPSRPAACASRV
jgi:hypothetical protein